MFARASILVGNIAPVRLSSAESYSQYRNTLHADQYPELCFMRIVTVNLRVNRYILFIFH